MSIISDSTMAMDVPGASSCGNGAASQSCCRPSSKCQSAADRMPGGLRRETRKQLRKILLNECHAHYTHVVSVSAVKSSMAVKSDSEDECQKEKDSVKKSAGADSGADCSKTNHCLLLEPYLIILRLLSSSIVDLASEFKSPSQSRRRRNRANCPVMPFWAVRLALVGLFCLSLAMFSTAFFADCAGKSALDAPHRSLHAKAGAVLSSRATWISLTAFMSSGLLAMHPLQSGLVISL